MTRRELLKMAAAVPAGVCLSEATAVAAVHPAQKIAKIETRKLTRTDCVCTNEMVYYQPLTEVRNSSPAYSKTLSFQGKDFDNRWTTHNIRSSFLATFQK